MPLLSFSVTVPSDDWLDTLTSMAPWVELLPKFCAMPLMPAAMTVPPVMVASPLKSSAALPLLVEPET